MEQYPQSVHDDTEAQSVSKILARSDPADMPAMRTSLSFLTYAGAEMAGALQKRNQEYDELKAVMSAFPREWIEAARGGGDLPDLGAMRLEMEALKDQRVDLQAQLAERETTLNDLQDQLAELRAQLETQVVREDEAEAALALTARVEALEADIEAAQLARSASEDALRERDAELDDLEVQLTALNDEFAPLLLRQPGGENEAPPELQDAPAAEISGESGVAVADEAQPPMDGRERRAVKLGTLFASVAAFSQQHRQIAQALQASSDQVDMLKGELFAVQSDRMALDADLQEKNQGLTDSQAEVETLQAERESLTSQIEELTAQSSTLQADLDTATASLAETREQLTARENELAEIHQQIDSLCQQLGITTDSQPALGDEAVDAGAAVRADVVPVELTDDEGQDAGGAQKLLGIGALAAGVGTLADNKSTQEAQLADLHAQVEALTAEKATLEAQVLEQQQALDDLTAQIEPLNATIADLTGQVETLTATVAEQQQQLDASQAELQALNEQMEAARATLLEIIPEGELPGEGEEGEPVEDDEDQPARRKMALAALAGSAAVAHHRNKDKEDELQSQVASYDEQVTALTAEKTGLEAQMQEQATQIEALTAQVSDLQTNLDTITAARQELEAALQEKEQALADYNDGFLNLQGDVNSLAAEKSSLETALQLKEQELAQFQAQLAAHESDLAEVQETATRSLGTRAAGVGAVTAGAVAAAALQDKDEQLEAAAAQLADLQTQLDGVLARKAEVEEQLAAQSGELEATRSRLASAAPFEEAAQLSDKLAQMPPAKRGAATAAVLAGTQPYFVSGVQALNDIHGIGQAFQQRLYKAGIGTYWEVSCLSNEAMQESLQIPEIQLDRVDYNGIRANAYEWASETGSIGALWEVAHVDDFEALPGIGATFEKRLYMAGIFNYEQLVAAGRDRVAEIIDAPEFRQPDYDEVIETARSRMQATPIEAPTDAASEDSDDAQ